MKFKSYYGTSKDKGFRFDDKTPKEIVDHYLQQYNNDPQEAYRFLKMAADSKRREPEVARAIYNAQLSLYNMIQSKNEKPINVDKWKQFEDALKKHDWNYEMGDLKSYQKGFANHQKLREMYKELAKEDKERANELVKKIVPKDKQRK